MFPVGVYSCYSFKYLQIGHARGEGACICVSGPGVASGKTTRIDLPEPVPVLLTYFTAWGAGGEVQFRRDIYDRDAALLAALNDGFRQ